MDSVSVVAERSMASAVREANEKSSNSEVHIICLSWDIQYCVGSL